MPFEDEILKTELTKQYDLYSKAGLIELFSLPIKCILKIKKSVERWSKLNGSNGYLNFITDQLSTLLDQMETFEYFYEEIKGR